MSNDNYPAGVTNAHPHFNPPREIAATVECGADEALVIPSFAVKAWLNELADHLNEKERMGGINLATVKYRIIKLRESIDELEQEHEYECPFRGEIDLEESECAMWVCPTCGNDRETDTMPEGPDPDRAYDEWKDSRYDD